MVVPRITYAARIEGSLATVIGGQASRLQKLVEFQRLFGNPPKLPVWWIYGPLPRWLSHFLQAVRSNGFRALILVLPCMLFALEQTATQGMIHAISLATSALFLLSLFTISWVWPIDALQERYAVGKC